RRGIAAPCVEGVVEMQDSGALGLFAASQVLAHLPVERSLQGVFDAQGSTLDEEEVASVGGWDRQTRKAVHELGVGSRVDVAVGRLGQRGIKEFFPKVRISHLRVVVTNRTGREVREEVEKHAVAAGIVEIGTAASLKI